MDNESMAGGRWPAVGETEVGAAGAQGASAPEAEGKDLSAGIPSMAEVLEWTREALDERPRQHKKRQGEVE